MFAGAPAPAKQALLRGQRQNWLGAGLVESRLDVLKACSKPMRWEEGCGREQGQGRIQQERKQTQGDRGGCGAEKAGVGEEAGAGRGVTGGAGGRRQDT